MNYLLIIINLKCLPKHLRPYHSLLFAPYLLHQDMDPIWVFTTLGRRASSGSGSVDYYNSGGVRGLINIKITDKQHTIDGYKFPNSVKKF